MTLSCSRGRGGLAAGWFRALWLETAGNVSYTNGVKVAVSIPDDVFDNAEQMARELKTSRSNLYARALAEFVERRAPDRITQAINEVVDAVGTASDGFTQAAARRALERTGW